MLIDFSELELEGREVIVDGLRAIDIFPDLTAALSDCDANAIDMTFDRSDDFEIKIAAGLFSGILRVVDTEQFPKTAFFCKDVFLALCQEIQWRESPARTAMMN